jgi:hypothetical protein
MKQWIVSLIVLGLSAVSGAQTLYVSPAEVITGPDGYYETTSALYAVDNGSHLEMYSVLPKKSGEMDLNTVELVTLGLQPVTDTQFLVIAAAGPCPETQQALGEIINITKVQNYLLIEAQGEVMTLQKATAEQELFFLVVKSVPNDKCVL